MDVYCERRRTLASQEELVHKRLRHLNSIPYAELNMHQRHEIEDLESERADVIKELNRIDAFLIREFSSGASELSFRAFSSVR
jgi:hypothetical protein